jgi:hypothetical protein
MGSVRATVAVAAPVEIVYHYLLNRYHRPAACETSLATKGYVPTVHCVESDELRYLCFSVKGRDAWTKTSIGGWEWEYRLREVGDTHTEVTICYRWDWVMAFLGAGTVRHQACNEIVETAMALDALGWPARLGDGPPPSSTGIRE